MGGRWPQRSSTVQRRVRQERGGTARRTRRARSGPRAPTRSASGFVTRGRKCASRGLCMYGFQASRAVISRLRVGDLQLGRRGRPAVELLPLRNRLRDRGRSHRAAPAASDRRRRGSRRCSGLRPAGADQHEPVDRARAHRRHLRRRPAADRLAEQVRPARAGGLDEPEIEAREVVDALHPLRVAGARRSPDAWAPTSCSAPPPAVHPAPPAAVAAGAVQHQQRIAPPAHPGVDVDAADRIVSSWGRMRRIMLTCYPLGHWTIGGHPMTEGSAMAKSDISHVFVGAAQLTGGCSAGCSGRRWATTAGSG